MFPLSPAGTAEVSLDSLALGSHPITAKYSGDDSIAENSSAPFDQVVNLPIFTISELASEQPEGTTPGTGPIDFTFTVTKNETTPGPGFDRVIRWSAAGAIRPSSRAISMRHLRLDFQRGHWISAPAAGSQVLSLRVRPDDLFEPDESFTVSLSNLTAPSLAFTTASGTILNDDELRISIDASQATAMEAQGGAPGIFTISRNGDDGQVSIDLQLAPSSTATYPADFTLSNVAGGNGAFTATIPEGSSSIEISLMPVDDIAAEASEFAATAGHRGTGIRH